MKQRINIFLSTGQSDSGIHLACLMLTDLALSDLFAGCAERQIAHDGVSLSSEILTLAAQTAIFNVKMFMRDFRLPPLCK